MTRRPEKHVRPDNASPGIGLHGTVADNAATVAELFPRSVTGKFEIHSYRGAAAVLSLSFPEQFHQIVRALEGFEITSRMIRMPGGSKGLIAKYVDTLFPEPDWKETRITADLHVRLEAANGNDILHEYVRTGYLDGHRIDL